MTDKISTRNNILKQFQKLFPHDFNLFFHFKILSLKFIKIFFFFVDSFLLYNYERFFSIIIDIDINRSLANFNENKLKLLFFKIRIRRIRLLQELL